MTPTLQRKKNEKLHTACIYVIREKCLDFYACVLSDFSIMVDQWIVSKLCNVVLDTIAWSFIDITDLDISVFKMQYVCSLQRYYILYTIFCTKLQWILPGILYKSNFNFAFLY